MMKMCPVRGVAAAGCRQLLLALAEWLCANQAADTRAARIVADMHLFILPSMNPDGFERRQRGNARQVCCSSVCVFTRSTVLHAVSLTSTVQGLACFPWEQTPSCRCSQSLCLFQSVLVNKLKVSSQTCIRTDLLFAACLEVDRDISKGIVRVWSRVAE